jgi:hypothetical protein
VFKTWQGGEPEYSLMSPDAGPNHLMIDGSFTDEGLRRLEGLDGLFGFTLSRTPAHSRDTSMTSAAFAPLARLPRLGFFGCEGELCDDAAMRHIAAMPRLRMLLAQARSRPTKGSRP